MKYLSNNRAILLPIQRCSFAALTIMCCMLQTARATPPSHNVAAGIFNVQVNDFGDTTASVTVTCPYSINDYRVRAGSNRGDYNVQIGSDATDDVANGVLMSSACENGKDAGTGFRTNCITTVDFNANGWLIDVFSAIGLTAGNNPEYNVNVAGAYFPYSSWYGGIVKNSTNANGGTMDTITGTPGLLMGTHFIDSGVSNGTFTVDLRSFGIDSRSDGVLLVTGGKNESANFGLVKTNSDGTWKLFIKDDGNNTATTFEQDPIAFVFIPKTNTALISGRFLGNASIEMYSGASPQFTVTSNAAGVYELKPTGVGVSATNGVLIISAEGGRTVNQDNFVSYELNAAQDGWIIQSRDCSGAGLEAIPATEPVCSFAFVLGGTPGFTVTPTNNLFTSENATTASFTVVLHKLPTADVTIPISSSNPNEGAPSVTSLTFTTNDWNIPQTVTITGVDDAVVDGNVAYTIVLGAATSTDPNWNGLDPADVSVVNVDNDGGITVTPTSGLVTTEAGGTAQFNVHLNFQPAADVTIGLSSSNPSEGTVSPTSLTFDSVNWNTDQPVTVTGVNDFTDDGDVAYTIVTAPAVSADSNFNGQNAPDVSVVNVDNDTAGVSVSAAGPFGLSILEGKTNSYTVVLNSQPAANVTVTVASSNTSQGGTVSPATLSFTSGNWSNAQTVTVVATDDFITDGNTSWAITNKVTSSDPLYAAIAPIPVLMTTVDNEPAVTLPSGTLIYGLGLAGVGIDGRAAIVDTNTPNYNGTTLTVTLTANGTSDDRLEIRNTGTGTGEIGVSGSNISYEGTTIGSFSGGVGITPLVVGFNGAATPVSGQALLRNVTFRNLNSNPLQNTRTVSVVLAHPDSGTGTATNTIRVGLLRALDFQQALDHGYGLYTNEADCHLREADPNTPYPLGSGGGLFMDPADPLQHNAFQVLMRFDNIFGDGFGQIPTNAIIVSAELVLTVPPTDSNGPGDGSPLYRMLIPWNENAETWTSMGSGVDQDDVESRSAFDSQLGVSDGSGSTSSGPAAISVLPDLLAWQAGAANYGWVMPGWANNLDGTTVSPGEAALEEERPRLKILWLPPGQAVASFRQNVSGYTSTVDTRVRQNAPDTSFGTVATVFSDWAVSGTSDNEHVLMRFDNIIGTQINQIPPGSRVHAAVLDLASTANNAMGHGGSFHPMLQPWQDTSTWNSLVNGVSADDVEAVAASSADAGSAALKPFVQGGYHTFELTADVQSWVNATRQNYGWAILPWPNGTDGWGIATSENATERDRPQLRVYYAPSLAIRSITRGATTATIQFTGTASTTFSMQRATTVNGTYTTIDTATTDGSGNGSYTDNSPPAGQAFYRISSP